LDLSAAEVAKLTKEAAAKNRSGRLAAGAQSDEALSKNPHAEWRDGVASIDLSKVDPSIKMLSIVLVHSPESRDWLLAEDWRTKLDGEPDAELVETILTAEHLLKAEAGLQTFLSTAPSHMEAALVQILECNPPPHPLAVAQDCLQEFEKRSIRRRIDTLKARQRESNVALEEASGLHQQILDLQRRLFDIARPFSPLR
jgi:hypothetical protein